PHTEPYLLSLHDALPISFQKRKWRLLEELSLQAQEAGEHAQRPPVEAGLGGLSGLGGPVGHPGSRVGGEELPAQQVCLGQGVLLDRKSTRLNSSHVSISY